MNYVLTKNDLDELDTLVRVSESIYETEMNLCFLESKGKLGTNEFQRKIECLKASINLANNIFESLSDNFNKNKAYIQFLYAKIKKEMPDFPDASKSFFPVINYFNVSKNLLIAGRLTNRFSAKCLNSKEGMIKDVFSILNADTSILEECDEEAKDLLMNAIVADPAYDFYLTTDMNSLFLTILLGLSQSTNAEKILQIKYESCFMLENLENTYVGNNFNVDMHPYLIHSCIPKMYNLSEDVVKAKKSEWLKKCFQMSAKSYLVSMDYGKENEILFYQSYVRAVLILADDDELSELYELAQKMINSAAFYQTSKDKLLKVFDCIKEDKYIPLVLSFGL